MQTSRRVSFVTGAGRGIGRAIAMALADAGHAVAVSARTSADVEAVAREIGDQGGEASWHVMDVTDPSACQEAMEKAESRLGAIDILVNNAGIAESASLDDTTDELWDRHVAVNVTAPFVLSRMVAPGMRSRGWGRIINIGSTASVKGYPYVTAYTATKHALLGMTRAMGRELVVDGVTVNAVCPGFVDTDLTRQSIDRIVEKTGVTSEEALEQLLSDSPLGRLVSPEEVAEAVVQLTGSESGAISGQAIGVCGGVIEG